MRLFISYAHIDLWQVTQLVELLRNANHEVWFEDTLPPGEAWQAHLLEKIQSCDALVYVLSPESAASAWCKWEYAQAASLNKPIIPVLIRANTTLPDALKSTPYADFTQGLRPESIAKLLTNLAQWGVSIPPEQRPLIPVAPIGIPARAETIQKHIFLSYSRRDKAWMERLRDSLRGSNLAVWTDESITPGSASWKDVLEKAIENAGCVAVVLSPDAKSSLWVKKEIDYALALKLPIIPILVRGSEADAVPFALIGGQYIDFMVKEYAKGLDELITIARGALTAASPAGSSAEQSPSALANLPTVRRQFDNGFWDDLLNRIRNDRCVPFLGDAIDGDIFPSKTEIAGQLAREQDLPFESLVYDLAQVAQFMSVERGRDRAKEEIMEKWFKTGAKLSPQRAYDPFGLLASLPFSLYVTTNYDDLLASALRHVDRQPHALYRSEDDGWQNEPSELSLQKPTVFHLYGSRVDTSSLVITEDDFLQLVSSYSSKELRFPRPITERLPKSYFLFLGFSANDWSMRALFPILSSVLERGRRGREPHIAIQVEPIRSHSSSEQVGRVREYLSRYFNRHLASAVDVYIENTQSFMGELSERWGKEQAKNG